MTQRVSVVLGALSTAVALTLAGSVPAQAVPQPNDRTVIYFNTLGAPSCLDANLDGRTYVTTCKDNDPYHQWNWFDAGGDSFRLQNQRTQACLARSGDGIRTAPCNTGDANQRWFVADSIAHLGGVDIYNYVNYNYLEGDEDTHELKFRDGPGRAWSLKNVNK